MPETLQRATTGEVMGQVQQTPCTALSSSQLPPPLHNVPGVRCQEVSVEGKGFKWIDITAGSPVELRDRLRALGICDDDILQIPLVEWHTSGKPPLRKRKLFAHVGKDSFVSAHVGDIAMVDRTWAKSAGYAFREPVDVLLRILRRLPGATLDAVSGVEDRVDALEREARGSATAQRLRERAVPIEHALEAIGDTLRRQNVTISLLRIIPHLAQESHHPLLDGLARAIDAVSRHAQHERGRLVEVVDRVAKERSSELAEQGASLGRLQKNLAIFRGLTAPLLCMAGAAAGAAGGSWPIIAVGIGTMLTGLYLSKQGGGEGGR